MIDLRNQSFDDLMSVAFLNPSKVLKLLKLKDNMIAADFGSGSGGWVIPLAKKLEDGKVYAIDILEEPLSALRSKADLQELLNIKTVLSNLEAKEGSKLPGESCDLVLMTNLLFQAEDKKGILEEGKRVLKKGAKLLIVDWLENSPLGPKKGRVSPNEVKKIAKEIGLGLKEEFSAGTCHWGLILVK